MCALKERGKKLSMKVVHDKGARGRPGKRRVRI